MEATPALGHSFAKSSNTSTTQLLGSFPGWDGSTPPASLHPFPGLSQVTPTWPDCNLSADLLERQRQKAHVEADGVKGGDLLPGMTVSARLPREPLASRVTSLPGKKEESTQGLFLGLVSDACSQPRAAGILKP